MRKDFPMDFVIALLALGLALWAVVRVEGRSGREFSWMKEITANQRRSLWMMENSPLAPKLKDHDERLSALEALNQSLFSKVESLEIEATIRRGQGYEPGAWPAVLRTPSAPRPEVRHVETDEEGR